MPTALLRCATYFAVSSTIILNIACNHSTPPAAATTAPLKMSQLPKDAPLSSAASTAPVLVPDTLKFSNQSIKAIQAGTKIGTVRKGIRTFPNGVIKATSGTSEPLILQNVVTASKKLSELTEGDAKANGSDSLDDLKADLSRDYPGIGPDDVVTVITFRLAPSDASK